MQPLQIQIPVEKRFRRLAREWRNEIELSSSMTEIVMHPKYQSIIGLGPDVVPILLQELRDNPDYWFWALRAITEEDPIRPEDYGDLQKMANAWLEWVSNKGY